MTTHSVLRFVACALKSRCAFVDMDGCVLRPMQVPACVPAGQRLDYWTRNLHATPVVKRRLPLLYLLRALGVRLYIWTNRSPQHRDVTIASLGFHARLFAAPMFFMAGRKHTVFRFGPCIDDEPRYVSGGDLLVRAARPFKAVTPEAQP